MIRSLLALVALAAGFLGGSHSPANSGHRQSSSAAAVASQWKTAFVNGVVKLRYPPDWHVAYYSGVGSSAAAPIIGISDAPIGNASSWPSPRSPSFAPGAAYAVVSDVGNDGIPFHPNTTVNRHQAHLMISASAGGCGTSLPHAKSLFGLIVRDAGNFVGFTACLPPSAAAHDTMTLVTIFHSIRPVD